MKIEIQITTEQEKALLLTERDINVFVNNWLNQTVKDAFDIEFSASLEKIKTGLSDGSLSSETVLSSLDKISE